MNKYPCSIGELTILSRQDRSKKCNLRTFSEGSYFTQITLNFRKEQIQRVVHGENCSSNLKQINYGLRRPENCLPQCGINYHHHHYCVPSLVRRLAVMNLQLPSFLALMVHSVRLYSVHSGLVIFPSISLALSCHPFSIKWFQYIIISFVVVFACLFVLFVFI